MKGKSSTTRSVEWEPIFTAITMFIKENGMTLLRKPSIVEFFSR